MAVSTFQVFGVIILAITLAFVIWLYVITLQRKKFLDSYVYARAANATLPPPSTPGTNPTAQLNLSCGEGREICIFRATQVCSGNQKDTNGNIINNFEIRETDPISSGNDNNGVGYGGFNPSTTIDMTDALTTSCKGQNKCQYTFDPNSATTFTNGDSIEGGWSTFCSANSQFISSYTCIPIGGECENYKNASQKIPTPGITTS